MKKPVVKLSKDLTAHQWLKWVFGLLLVGFFAFLYIALAPDLAYQPWDSLDYSYSTEVIGISTIRGNHPLGHVILFLAFSLFKNLGYTGRALTVFQITNGLIGGLTVALCFAMLVQYLDQSLFRAFGFAAILGASYSFWFFSGTGDIYSIAFMFSLIAWADLIHEIYIRNNPWLLLPGVLVGLAILSHQLNVTILPVGIMLILQSHEENQIQKIKIKQIVTLTASTIITVSVGYFLLGYLATSTFLPARILGWARGYFGDPSYGRYLNPQYFSTALLTATQAILISPSNKAEAIRTGLLVLFFLLMLSGLLVNKTLDKHKRSILKAAALQCFITWPLILWWEPQNLKFWLLTLLPWVIFLTLSFEAVELKIRSLLSNFSPVLEQAASLTPLFIGIFIFSINTRYGMLSQHTDQSIASIAFHQALAVWVNHSGPNDVLITAGDLVPDLLYWGDRSETVNLYRSLQVSQSSSDSFSDLRRLIEQALCNHHTVLLTPVAGDYIPDNQLSIVNVSRASLKAFFTGYRQHGTIAFWYRDLIDNKRLPVYAITQAEACLN
jgi:hypothetical protein